MCIPFFPRQLSGSFLARKHDIVLLGDIDEVVKHVAELCGWLEELETMECSA